MLINFYKWQHNRILIEERVEGFYPIILGYKTKLILKVIR